MDALQQRLEVERAIARDHDLAVEHDPRRQQRRQRPYQLGEVPLERLLVAALQRDLVAVLPQQRAEAIPLRLELPAVTIGQRRRQLAQHRRQRPRHRERHRASLPGSKALILPRRGCSCRDGSLLPRRRGCSCGDGVAPAATGLPFRTDRSFLDGDGVAPAWPVSGRIRPFVRDPDAPGHALLAGSRGCAWQRSCCAGAVWP